MGALEALFELLKGTSGWRPRLPSMDLRRYWTMVPQIAVEVEIPIYRDMNLNGPALAMSRSPHLGFGHTSRLLTIA